MRVLDSETAWTVHLSDLLEDCGLEADVAYEAADGVRLALNKMQVYPPFPDDLLSLLASRCLFGMGLPAMAEVCLQNMSPERRELYRCYVSGSIIDRRTWGVLSTHWLTAQRYGAGYRWQLHLSRMPFSTGQLEITGWMCLRQLLEVYRPVWASCRGRMQLEINGLRHMMALFPADVTPTVILQYVKDYFQKLKQQEDWGRLPEVRHGEVLV